MSSLKQYNSITGEWEYVNGPRESYGNVEEKISNLYIDSWVKNDNYYSQSINVQGIEFDSNILIDVNLSEISDDDFDLKVMTIEMFGHIIYSYSGNGELYFQADECPIVDIPIKILIIPKRIVDTKEMIALLPMNEWINNETFYYQNLTIYGIHSINKLIIDVDLSSISDFSQKVNILENWGYIVSSSNYNNYINFKAEYAPEIDIPIKIFIFS